MQNRKSYANDPLLTKFTKSTGLQWSTNWTLCIKPSLLRPSHFLLSPLYFSLSMSSNLTFSSVIFFISLFCLQQNSPLPSLNYPILEFDTWKITSITNERKMTKESKYTLNGIQLVLIIWYLISWPCPILEQLTHIFLKSLMSATFLLDMSLYIVTFEWKKKRKIVDYLYIVRCS